MKKRRILITGSSGMLGMDLTFLLGDKYDVICADIVKRNNPYCEIKNFMLCDITNKQTAIDTVKQSKADVVVHAAAWADVDACELDEEKAMKVNAEGAHNIALGCKESKAALFYIGSDFVFDGDKDGAYKEEDKTNPLNVYGMSKLKGEEFIKRELDRYFIVRTSWLFGRNGRNFVDIILDKAERKEELKVVADQFGCPTYTVDLSKALKKLISIALTNGNLGGVYHFSNSGSCSWYKYAQEIMRISGKNNVKLTPIISSELNRPAIRPGISILDTGKYSQVCKEKPRDWALALEDYLAGS
ncbi:MAG: dTDP-4-dehydrorhamnose reductase [Candidatus Omnitrophota bacterium]|nr:dTDP-4-dehydrorhamnose reductase [Candidatus Omnitrophota bacterium]